MTLRLCLLTVLFAGSAAANAATPEQIQKAITRGVEYIYSQQKDHNWEHLYTKREDLQEGGYTAFATYTLLASGEPSADPRIAKAVDWLIQKDMKGTYALGVRSLVWSHLPPNDRIRNCVKRDAALLMETLKAPQQSRGFYAYTYKTGGYFDHSCSQYGVLGMWALAQTGLEIPSNYWDTVDKAWRRTQDAGGGWGYAMDPANAAVKPSMTAAGVATLFISSDQLNYGKAVQCKGNIVDPNITKGMKWMEDNFTKAINSSPYTLYGIERISRASGYKYFGTNDWFKVGADRLVKSQGADGSWTNLTDTCFAVLFLVRGRAPVVMNKLEYTLVRPDGPAKPGNWNQRPRDTANFVQWLSKQTERTLNWQIVNLDVAPEEWHDAPILYIAGNEHLNFSEADLAKLRRFVEGGGLILGNADCAAEPFAKSFKQLGTMLFPAYEFRELPDNHPIYTEQAYPRSKWKSRPSVLGLSNGARELMILIPAADASKTWYLMAGKTSDPMAQFTADLYQYLTERRNPPSKGDSHIVQAAKDARAKTKVSLARLEYAGNWDPEPGGWRRLANVVLNRSGIGLTVTPVKLGDGKLAGHQIAHLTGTASFKLSDTQRNELRTFANAGGTLIVDSGGGATAFAESAEAELAMLFPAEAKGLADTLPTSHTVFAPGGDKPEILYRAFARRALGGQPGPRLRGIDINGRTAVFYSREDLSVGLVGQLVDGVLGYDPKSATNLMAWMIQYAASPKPATTQPK